MRYARIIGAIAIVAAGTAAWACTSDETSSGTDTTFSIALKIEGEGTVTSTPEGFACTGPKDCGAHAFPAGTVKLAAPHAPIVVVKWKLDGVDSVDDELSVEGTAGATHTVVATFELPGPDSTDGGGGNGNGGGDGGAGDGGAGDGGGDAGAGGDAGPSIACGSTTCSVSTCCVSNDAKQFTCTASCAAPSVVAECTKENGCADGGVCCAAMKFASNTFTLTGLTCTAPGDCNGAAGGDVHQALCDATMTCDGGLSCHGFGPDAGLLVCQPGF